MMPIRESLNMLSFYYFLLSQRGKVTQMNTIFHLWLTEHPKAFSNQIDVKRPKA